MGKGRVVPILTVCCGSASGPSMFGRQHWCLDGTLRSSLFVSTCRSTYVTCASAGLRYRGRARQVLTLHSAKGVAANEDQATGQRMSALAQSCCTHVASTCGIKLTLEEFSCKNRYYGRSTQGYEKATKITVKTLGLLYFYGSGGGTRTPDTRI